MKRVFYALLLLAAAMLVSCGGGGGGDNSASSTSTAPATVGLVITDASTDDWDQALATITSVSLISDGGHEVLFTGEKTVDLLSLREHLKLFLVKKAVRPGHYSKIRLEIKEMVLVKDDGVNPPVLQDVKVPSNKVDLNPKGTFYIAPGSVVFASLDWDMEKSLKFTETGSGKWIMRPVIFVNIGSKPGFKNGLARLSGFVRAVESDGSSFRLCSTQATPTPVPATLSYGDDDHEWCVDVMVTDKTSIFGSDGQPKAVKEVTLGEEVTVVGLLRRDDDDDDDHHYEYKGVSASSSSHDDDDDDDDDEDDDRCEFEVVALVVESGPEGTWVKLRGALASLVDTEQRFDFDPDANQGYDDATILTAQLFDESRIFRLGSDGALSEITAGELKLNDRAVLDAVPLASTTTPDDPDLNVAIMLTRPGLLPVKTLTGTISYIESDGSKVWLNGNTDCAAIVSDTIDSNTKVYLLSDSGVIEGSVTDLAVGNAAVVTGTVEDSAGCLRADMIVSKAAVSPTI